MEKSKGKLAQKLLIYILPLSFLLIMGSFLYFYLSGLSFLNRFAENEIDLYKNQFVKSADSQLEDYNNKIDAYLIKSGVSLNSNTNDKKMLSKFLEENYSFFEIIHYQNKVSKNTFSLKPVVVFGGKKIIEEIELEKEEFFSLYNSILIIKEFYKGSIFGFKNENKLKSLFIRKDIGQHSLLLKVNKISFFNNIIEKLYFPDNISFNILNEENVFEFSTNRKWINQKADKYLNSDYSKESYSIDLTGELLIGNSFSIAFENPLLIANNMAEIRQYFNDILSKLFVYSIVIFSVILIISLVYTNKISDSLNEISRVAKLVSQGDFSNKIRIRRNDEIGVLIETFNTMLNNLQTSYQKLDITNKELENKIDELIHARAELTKQQKLALIGETISKISHEIQNKISGVSVWIQNLEMQTKPNPTTEMYIEEIKKSLCSFSHMLQNFKKFYRKPCLELRPSNIEKIIDRVINSYRADISARNLEVIKLYNSKIDRINIDPYLIEEVIINVFVNALYYSSPYGKIIVDTETENSNYIISIIDSGIGIKDEDMENLFNPFFTTKSSGSGLGLAISKNIIDAHGGKIIAENNKPSGAVFKILIPIK